MAKGKKNQLPSLTVEELEQLDLWLASNAEQIPDVVKKALSHYESLRVGLADGGAKLRAVLIQFRLALGITPSSEKRQSSGSPIGALGAPRSKDPKEQLILSIAHLDQLKEWHKKMARQHARKAKNLVDKLTKLEDIELTPEEVAEDKQEAAEYVQRLQLGEGADPSFESPNQAFMKGGDVRLEEEQAVALVDPVLLEGEQIVDRLIDERLRYGFNITVSQVTVAVEKVIVKDVGSSTRIISASREHRAGEDGCDLGIPRQYDDPGGSVRDALQPFSDITEFTDQALHVVDAVPKVCLCRSPPCASISAQLSASGRHDGPFGR